MRLMIPPLPAASRPSKRMTILAPVAFTHSCSFTNSVCSLNISLSYSLLFIFACTGLFAHHRSTSSSASACRARFFFDPLAMRPPDRFEDYACYELDDCTPPWKSGEGNELHSAGSGAEKRRSAQPPQSRVQCGIPRFAAHSPHELTCGCNTAPAQAVGQNNGVRKGEFVSARPATVTRSPLTNIRGEVDREHANISAEVSLPNLLPRKRASLRILQPEVTYTGAPIKPLHRGLPKATESLCPECTKVIPAMALEDDSKVIMQKNVS